jgi:hypothetical protein
MAISGSVTGALLMFGGANMSRQGRAFESQEMMTERLRRAANRLVRND